MLLLIITTCIYPIIDLFVYRKLLLLKLLQNVVILVAMKIRNPYLNILLLSILLIITYSVDAQSLYYSAFDNTNDMDNTIYIAGKQDNNIVVWLYKQTRKTLQINIYNSKMELLNQASLNMDNIENFYSLHFLRKGNYYDVLVQYGSKKQVTEEIISFNKTNKALQALKTLSRADAYGVLMVKNSDNGKYTGFIKAYKTIADSILIQYTIYDDQYALISDFSFVLPQKHDAIDLEASLIDDAGNLAFYATKDKGSPFNQNITIYEANLEKDKLLQEDIVKEGRFSEVVIQQNKTNKSLIVSGIWTTGEGEKNISAANSVNQSLFVIELNKDFYQEKEMALYSVSNIIDSIYTDASSSVLRSEKLVLSGDSGFVFYASGLTHYSNPMLKTYKNHNVRIPELPSFYRVQAPDPSKSIASFSRRYDSDKENDYNNGSGGIVYSPLKAKGENFILTLTTTNSDISSINKYIDSTKDFSTPDDEYIVNTGNNIHYIYSRILKWGKRQLITDLSLDQDGHMHLNPVVTTENYKLTLNAGIQVSASTIIFPFINKGQLRFAKMDIE
jgi:hypothetical protein